MNNMRIVFLIELTRTLISIRRDFFRVNSYLTITCATTMINVKSLSN